MALGVVHTEEGRSEEAGFPHQADELDRSLVEDVEALIDDGKTYLQAELAFQKTRAAFVAGEAKNVAIFGAAAAGLAVLALIGLTVGLIFALTPLITAWGATAVVVGVELVATFVAAKKAMTAIQRITGAMGSGTEPTK